MSADGALALAIEASTRRGSVAVGPVAGGTPRVEELDEHRGHGSDLMPAVASLVPRAEDLGLVVVGRGPGSYTGLRVGAATALGLALGTGARLVGVDSLAAVALAGLAPGERGVVLRNAFGGRMYVAGFLRDAEGRLEAEGAAEALVAAEAVERACGVPVALVDDGARAACAQRVEASGADTELRAASGGAGELYALALGAHGVALTHGPEAVQPLYLRPFEAKNRRR